MKKLLLMLLVFISLSAMSQTRPPIVTNEIRTNLIKWNDLLMYRDSLVYFRPIDAKSFQVKRPSSSVWSTYDFTEIPDSFFIPDLDVWIVVGQPITQGDSTFYVRQKPNCPNCWQYSYDNGFWYNWFCSETGASNLSIDYNADEILGIHYNSGLGAYTDSLYFRILEADSGKVPMIIGDEVVWRPIPRDSLFDAYSSDWLKGGDTIPKQLDSILYGGEWIVSTKILINDTSKTNELDTIVINGQKLGNLDSIEVDLSETNELDSIFVLNVIGEKWKKNGDSVNIYFPYLDGVDPQMQPFDGDILTYNYDEDYWTSTTNQRDTIIINGTKYGHLDSVMVDSSNINELDSIQINGVWLANGESISVDPSSTNELDSKWVNYQEYLRPIESRGVFLGDYNTSSLSSFLNIENKNNSDTVGVIINTWGKGMQVYSVYDIGIDVFAGSEGGISISGFCGSGGSCDNWKPLLDLKTDEPTDFGVTYIQTDKGFSVVDSTTTTGALKVGSGATITRSGTIASKDIWTGTAAEFSANTVKDGITPQASTTIAFIID